jgi:peptidyl-prolyl cis-trans isomerase SurA
VPKAATPATAPAKQVATTKSGKPKKIKREKVRFGQAPRNALPPGPQETAVGAGAGEATSTQAGDAGAAVAPGTAIAPTDSTTQVLGASTDPDPLAPKPTNTGKTRFSARAQTMDAEKAAKKQAAVKQKAAFTPTAATAQEKADESARAKPLGLNGDTATKKKKKRQKGQPKERLQNKKEEAPAAPANPEPTVNPKLGATPAGVTPTPPPAPAPQPTAPQQ